MHFFLIALLVAVLSSLQTSAGGFELRCGDGFFLSAFFGAANATSVGLTCRSYDSKAILNTREFGFSHTQQVRRTSCRNDAAVITGVVVYQNNGSILNSIRGICSDGRLTFLPGRLLKTLKVEGSTHRRIRCPQSKVITGLRLRLSQSAQKLVFEGAICGFRVPSHKVREDNTVSLQVLDIKGHRKRVICQPGSLVTGIIAHSPSRDIQGFGLQCSSVSDGSHSIVNVLGGLAKHIVQRLCNGEFFLEGLEGTAGTILNSVQGTCFDGLITKRIGKEKGLDFRAACPVGQAVIGLDFSLDSQSSVNGLEVVCTPTLFVSYSRFVLPASVKVISDPPIIQSPTPSTNESTQLAERINRAKNSVVDKGYVGIIRLDEPTENSELCNIEPALSLTFEDLGLNSSSVGVSNNSRSVAPTYTDEELDVLCGNQTSLTRDGCMWNSTEFLGLLYNQGVYLLRSGATQRTSFSMYVHGVKLAWNRARCSPGSTKERFSLPVNYESLYGIMSARIVAAIKESGNMLPELQTVRPGRAFELEQMKARAEAWDVSEELPSTLFPTSEFLLLPSHTDASGISIQVSEDDLTSNSTNLTTDVRFLSPFVEPGLDFNHGSFDTNSSTKARSEDQLSMGTIRATTAFIPYLCGPWSQYFPLQYVSTESRPLVHYHQHCCSKACEAYSFLSRVSSIGSGLYQCCRFCNKFRCGISYDQEAFTILSSIIRTPAKTYFQSPSVYFFAV